MFSIIYFKHLLQKADVARLEDELNTVKSQLSLAQSKLSSMTSGHESELHDLKHQLHMVIPSI